MGKPSRPSVWAIWFLKQIWSLVLRFFLSCDQNDKKHAQHQASVCHFERRACAKVSVWITCCALFPVCRFCAINQHAFADQIWSPDAHTRPGCVHFSWSSPFCFHEFLQTQKLKNSRKKLHASKKSPEQEQLCVKEKDNHTSYPVPTYHCRMHVHTST